MMTTAHRLMDASFGEDSDRKLIRVDFPPKQAGIAAALRRAFQEQVRECESDDMFDSLLAKLH